LAQISEYLCDISDVVHDNTRTDKDRLREISLKLKALNFQDNIWEAFRVYFEEVNNSFFKRLVEKYPKLTSNELRICAYIAMNFPTKEIASLTNRSYRTIHSLKYRIHKKTAAPYGKLIGCTFTQSVISSQRKQRRK